MEESVELCMDFGHSDRFPLGKKGREWLMIGEIGLGTTGVGLGCSRVVFDLLMVMVGSLN